METAAGASISCLAKPGDAEFDRKGRRCLPHRTPLDTADERDLRRSGERPSKTRRRLESCRHALVDTGAARWRIDGDGNTEPHMHSGEADLFGEPGVTRLQRTDG